MYGNAYCVGEGKTYANNLLKLGETSLDGCIMNTGGYITRQKKTTKKVSIVETTTTTKKVFTVDITSRGFNVPKAVLNALGINAKVRQPVYLRPISSKSFLIMNKPGTNNGTITVYPQISGKLVLSLNTLDALFVWGIRATIKANGATCDTFIVTFWND